MISPIELPAVSESELQLARELHRRGRTYDALVGYRRFLKANPGHPGCTQLLGIINVQRGRTIRGLRLLEEAARLKADDSYAHSNVGILLMRLGRPALALSSYDQAVTYGREENTMPCGVLQNLGIAQLTCGKREDALVSFDAALRADPCNVEAMCRKGDALFQLERYEEAISSYEAALAAEPEYVVALVSRGIASARAGRVREGLASFVRAATVAEDSAPAHYNAGRAYVQLGRLEEAVSSFKQALFHDPQLPEAYLECGEALMSLRRFQEAQRLFETCSRLRARWPELMLGFANCWMMLGKPSEALKLYDEALGIDPSMSRASMRRTSALIALGYFAEAVDSCERLLRECPNDIAVLSNLGLSLLAVSRCEEASSRFLQVLALAPDCPGTLGHLVYSQMRCCDWAQREQQLSCLSDELESRRAICEPFALLCAYDDPKLQLESARRYIETNFGSGSSENACEWLRGAGNGVSQRGSNSRIHVAYVSADFHDHATAYLMAGMFEHHDRERFEITAISLGAPCPSPMRTRLEKSFDRFVDAFGYSDDDVLRLARETGIDIAVDLKGFTQGRRLAIFARRMAPLQVSYLGFPGSTGAPFIDYIIADKYVIPSPSTAYYSECVAYLPHCYQVNDDRRAVGARPSRKDAGLPESGFVYCCFNGHNKITPEVFAIWMELLNQVEGSVLWLIQGESSAHSHLRARADIAGVDSSRIIFAPWLEHSAHLGRYSLADLSLDTFPCNAHTTASDSLWAGVPILTRSGQTFASRVCGSLLASMGLPELITSSVAEYRSKALLLALDPTALSLLRERLAASRLAGPLYETARFTRNIERAFSHMYSRALSGQCPAEFSVSESDEDSGNSLRSDVVH